MITYTQQGDVAILNWDDGKVNSLGHATLDALNEQLTRAEKEAKAVVIVGRQGLFSAGFNLKEVAAEAPLTEILPPLVHKGALFLLRLFSHPLPIVAACTGHAIAAGAMILLASDTRIGSKGDFKTSLNETAINMIMPPFGAELVKARVTHRFQSRCLIQAEMFGTQDAEAAGFFDELVDPDQVIDVAIARATHLATLPGDKYAYNKMMLRQGHVDAVRTSLV
jgi:enoyl-CoA hydratase